IGSKCLLVIRVSGCSRVPLPPARITPLSEPSIGRGCYAPVGCDCSSKAAAGTWTRPAGFQCSVITVPLSRRPVLPLVAQTSLAKCVRSARGNEEPQKARRRPRSAQSKRVAVRERPTRYTQRRPRSRSAERDGKNALSARDAGRIGRMAEQPLARAGEDALPSLHPAESAAATATRATVRIPSRPTRGALPKVL